MRILSLTLAVLVLVVAFKIKDSPHGEALNISCSVCHSPAGWDLDPQIYSFNHDSTKMPLAGQHRNLNCRLCHPSLVFSEAGTECADCHTDIHAQTVGFECERCHTTHSWIVQNITEVHMMSRFPLAGPHAMADCMDCHASASSLRFDPLGIECIDCHRNDYEAAKNPDHAQGNISTNCIECHSMHAFTWSESGFNHLFFPLTAGHAIAECSRCHTGNDYAGLSSECYACHQQDYAATTNPSHAGINLSTSCEECHTTHPGWKPAQFPDHDAYFPLTGVHMITECSRCHDVNDYGSASSDCYACHQSDYESTTNPNHIAAMLSTNCVECHTLVPGWKPAEFRVHDAQFFPIYSGKHRNQWDNCTDCHLDLNNYGQFSCIDCHEHNRARMDDKHLGEVPGYQYNSVACLQCHPLGSSD